MTIIGVSLIEVLLAVSPLLGGGGEGLMPYALLLAALGALLGGIADYTRDRWIETLIWAIGTVWYLGRMANTLEAAAGLHTPELGIVWIILSAMLTLILPLGLLVLPLLGVMRGR